MPHLCTPLGQVSCITDEAIDGETLHGTFGTIEVTSDVEMQNCSMQSSESF